VSARHEHATSASRSSADGYEWRRPEETVLYTALQAHWKTFVSELEAVAEPPVLPAFVVAEVESYHSNYTIIAGCLVRQGRGNRAHHSAGPPVTARA
jgi:hypothetical protein